MKKIIVNGHGWSGSSAFINFLESSESNEYVIIPGEFDDFRVPGTMREVFDDSNNLSYFELNVYVNAESIIEPFI